MIDVKPLDQFRMEVNRALAIGEFADTELSVVDENGNRPVVVALGEERLSVLLRRVENVGGYANVFVQYGDVVRRLAVMDVLGALDVREADDMTSKAEQPSANSTVGAFVSYLAQRKSGILLPARLATPAHTALPARQVEVVSQ